MADMRLIVAGSRRPDGPGPDARHRGNTGCGAGRRAGGAGLRTTRQGFRNTGGPTRERRGELSGDLWAMSANADGILDFTVPAATIANVAIAAQRGLVHIIGTTGLSSSDDAVIKSVTQRAIVVKVRQYEPRRQSAGSPCEARRAIARREFRYRNPGNAPQVQDRCAVGHRAFMLGEAAAAGRNIALEQRSARGRDGHNRRTAIRRYRFCFVAWRHRGRRSQRDLCRSVGADHAGASCRGPDDFRPWRAEGSPVGAG